MYVYIISYFHYEKSEISCRNENKNKKQRRNRKKKILTKNKQNHLSRLMCMQFADYSGTNVVTVCAVHAAFGLACVVPHI